MTASTTPFPEGFLWGGATAATPVRGGMGPRGARAPRCSTTAPTVTTTIRAS